MLRVISAGCVCALSTVVAEPVRSGRATAEWLAESTAVPPGRVVRTAVRLVIDPHWHTYWVNPGEAGMPTTVEWELPAGWKAGSFSHPVPKAFRTGELAGYGHVGTADFPVEFTAPADFSGEVVLRGSVSWLACQDEACVPGEGRIELRVTAGEPSPTPAAKAVADAFAALPGPAPDGARLVLAEAGVDVVLTLSGAVPPLAGATVFPKTPDVLDPKAKIVFTAADGAWQARVPKGPYAAGKPDVLELLVVPPAPHRAFVVAGR